MREREKRLNLGGIIFCLSSGLQNVLLKEHPKGWVSGGVGRRFPWFLLVPRPDFGASAPTSASPELNVWILRRRRKKKVVSCDWPRGDCMAVGLGQRHQHLGAHWWLPEIQGVDSTTGARSTIPRYLRR